MKILVVDDDSLMGESFRLTFKNDDVTVVDSGQEALSLLNQTNFNIVFLDLELHEGLQGIKILTEIRAAHPLTPVIVMSGHSDDQIIKICLEKGAVDYLVKASVHMAAYKFCVHKASVWRKRQAEIVGHRRVTEKEMLASFDNIKGISQHICELKEKISVVGRTDGPFLIQGETGTGKEIVARSIWAAKDDYKRPFIVVNCAEFQPTTIESELFGYERGAFTGALSQKVGLFEAAHGGDIFLDEIGELALEAQAKLLRIIQEKRVRRMGSNAERSFEFRVIAATNRNLFTEAREGHFRQDLLYRLDVQAFFLEPLRHRKEDILALMEEFFEREGISDIDIDKDVIPRIVESPWPGNIRQLMNFVKFQLPYMDRVNPRLAARHWQAWSDKQRLTWQLTEAAKAGYSEQDILQVLKHGNFNYDAYSVNNKKMYIEAAMKLADDNRAQAARLLGVSRQRLGSWISELNMGI